MFEEFLLPFNSPIGNLIFEYEEDNLWEQQGGLRSVSAISVDHCRLQ